MRTLRNTGTIDTLSDVRSRHTMCGFLMALDQPCLADTCFEEEDVQILTEAIDCNCLWQNFFSDRPKQALVTRQRTSSEGIELTVATTNVTEYSPSTEAAHGLLWLANVAFYFWDGHNLIQVLVWTVTVYSLFCAFVSPQYRLILTPDGHKSCSPSASVKQLSVTCKSRGVSH